MSNLFDSFINRHNAFLTTLITEADIPAKRLKEAMHYSLFPGGKRLRPLLTYLTGTVLSLPIECLDHVAASIECMHTYSLVHDDLPAMDNDDFRRGKLSCHKAFDEATAILVGDGLQTLAFSTLATKLPTYLSAEQTLNIVHILAKASGSSGMLSGQMRDLFELSKETLTLDDLIQIHHLKTGKLFSACVEMVLSAQKAKSEDALLLTEFAHHFGLAFQLQDDYLDTYAPIDYLGKNRASDKANAKRTFAYYFTKEDLKEKIENTYQEAMSALDKLQNASILSDFIGLARTKIVL